MLNSTLNAQRVRLESDIHAAEVETRFAEKKLSEISSGADKQARIAALQGLLDAIAEQIAALQESLYALEMEEAVAKENAKSYYQVLEELSALINETNEEEITSSPEYIAAKARVDAVEASLAGNYSQQARLKAQIAEKSALADTYANDMALLQSSYDATQAGAVYRKMIQSNR